MKGYKIYHVLHPDNKTRGGSTVIIIENIFHYEKFKHEELEKQAEAICVMTKSYAIAVSSIYSPPIYPSKSTQFQSLLKNRKQIYSRWQF